MLSRALALAALALALALALASPAPALAQTSRPTFAPLAAPPTTKSPTPARAPTPPTTSAPTSAPTQNTLNVTITHYPKNVKCKGQPVLKQTYYAPYRGSVASGKGLCITDVPQSALVATPIKAWQASCSPRSAVGDGSQTLILNFKAWFAAAVCPAATANGAEQAKENNVGDNNAVCITDLFTGTDVTIAHNCRTSGAARMASASAVAAAALVGAIASLLF